MSCSLPWIAVALFCVVVPPAPAQESQRTAQVTTTADARRAQAINDLIVYRARVIDYHAGQDEAVGELLKWDRKRLVAALTLIRSRYDGTGPWLDATLRAASMMHTDAAIRCLHNGDDEAAFFH